MKPQQLNLFLADFNNFEPLCVSVPESHESHKDFPHGLTASRRVRLAQQQQRPPRTPPPLLPPQRHGRYYAVASQLREDPGGFFRFNTSNIGYRSWSCLCVFNLLPLCHGLEGHHPSTTVAPCLPPFPLSAAIKCFTHDELPQPQKLQLNYYV